MLLESQQSLLIPRLDQLMQATSNSAELLALSGKRNPYPGKLGVIEEGALADILLINGNPLEDISILTKPEQNLALIMKDGKIYKNQINWSARQEAEERIMEPVKSHRIKLRTLVVLQAVFAAMALGFLFTSGWYAYTTGAPLSAAPVVPSIVMFLIYSGCLLLPRFKIGWYWVAMAIVPFGVGGVLLNILNYLQNGLRDFTSFEVWCIAVGINGFGTVWNIVAAVGGFERPDGLARRTATR